VGPFRHAGFCPPPSPPSIVKFRVPLPLGPPIPGSLLNAPRHPQAEAPAPLFFFFFTGRCPHRSLSPLSLFFCAGRSHPSLHDGGPVAFFPLFFSSPPCVRNIADSGRPRSDQFRKPRRPKHKCGQSHSSVSLRHRRRLKENERTPGPLLSIVGAAPAFSSHRPPSFPIGLGVLPLSRRKTSSLPPFPPFPRFS